jgi:hypothetical protein
LSQPTIHSEIDENRDIMDLEMRDFNDEKGIEKDIYRYGDK